MAFILGYLCSLTTLQALLVGTDDEIFCQFPENTSEFWSKLTRQVPQGMGPYCKQSEMQSILDLYMGKKKINGFGANLENIKLM